MLIVVGARLRWRQPRVGVQPDITTLIALRFLTGVGLGGAMPTAITLDVGVLPEAPAVVARDADVLRLHDRLRDRRHRCRAGRHRVRLAGAARRGRPVPPLLCAAAGLCCRSRFAISSRRGRTEAASPPSFGAWLQTPTRGRTFAGRMRRGVAGAQLFGGGLLPARCSSGSRSS